MNFESFHWIQSTLIKSLKAAMEDFKVQSRYPTQQIIIKVNIYQEVFHYKAHGPKKFLNNQVRLFNSFEYRKERKLFAYHCRILSENGL